MLSASCPVIAYHWGEPSSFPSGICIFICVFNTLCLIEKWNRSSVTEVSTEHIKEGRQITRLRKKGMQSYMVKHIVSLSVCIWEHQDLLSDANKFPWIVYLHISWTVCFSQNQKDFHWAITILIHHHISKACAIVKHPWNFKTRHAWDFQVQRGETASLQLPKPLFIVPPNQGPCVLGGQYLDMLQKKTASSFLQCGKCLRA